MSIEVDEPIEVVPYDPSWPKLFDEEAKRLQIGISEKINSIEHFGSTSVPGMSGKPIVDLLFGANDMPQAHRIAEQVTTLGYENLGEVLIPGRVYLRRRGRQNFNVVIVVKDAELWRYFILVRDYLRENPDEVAAYSNAKRESIESGATMFLDYSYKKAPFLKALAERAIQWKTEKNKTH
jgi:GrpB-like predicted nucleotidyltransferase (UPF0157 family)